VLSLPSARAPLLLPLRAPPRPADRPVRASSEPARSSLAAPRAAAHCQRRRRVVSGDQFLAAYGRRRVPDLSTFAAISGRSRRYHRTGSPGPRSRPSRSPPSSLLIFGALHSGTAACEPLLRGALSGRTPRSSGSRGRALQPDLTSAVAPIDVIVAAAAGLLVRGRRRSSWLPLGGRRRLIAHGCRRLRGFVHGRSRCEAEPSRPETALTRAGPRDGRTPPRRPSPGLGFPIPVSDRFNAIADRLTEHSADAGPLGSIAYSPFRPDQADQVLGRGGCSSTRRRPWSFWWSS
jgi:hypothetical protein